MAIQRPANAARSTPDKCDTIEPDGAFCEPYGQVYDDKKGVVELSLNLGHVYQSTQCSSFLTLPHGQLGGKKGNVCFACLLLIQIMSLISELTTFILWFENL